MSNFTSRLLNSRLRMDEEFKKFYPFSFNIEFFINLRIIIIFDSKNNGGITFAFSICTWNYCWYDGAYSNID